MLDFLNTKKKIANSIYFQTHYFSDSQSSKLVCCTFVWILSVLSKVTREREESFPTMDVGSKRWAWECLLCNSHDSRLDKAFYLNDRKLPKENLLWTRKKKKNHWANFIRPNREKAGVQVGPRAHNTISTSRFPLLPVVTNSLMPSSKRTGPCSI